MFFFNFVWEKNEKWQENEHFLCITGTGIPEGPTAYVLTEDGTNGFLIWNANTGEHYKVHDNYCPLISIGCIINDENVRNVLHFKSIWKSKLTFRNKSIFLNTLYKNLLQGLSKMGPMLFYVCDPLLRSNKVKTFKTNSNNSNSKFNI